MNYAPMLTRVLRYGVVLTIVVVVVGGVIGYLVDGWHGLFSALIGAGVTAVFMGFTAASILIAGRVASGPDGIATFYGIVLGTWMLKLVIFVGLAIWLRTQSWLDPAIFGLTIIAAVIGSLVIDVVAFVRTRTPYSDAVLPGEGERPAEK
jgi:hypothetical protein